MKKLVTISLLFCILLSSLGQSVILVHYLINKNYYATVLCENKAKPKMNCHGKCHIMKEMKEQEKREQSPTAPIKEKQETVQFFQTNTAFTFNTCTETKKYSSFYLLPKIPSVSLSIFHPPTV